MPSSGGMPPWLPSSVARDRRIGRSAESMPNIAAGLRSEDPTASSARCCTHRLRSSPARMSLPRPCSMSAHVSHVFSLDGSLFTAHLYSCRARGTLPSRSSRTPHAWNRRHALRLRGATHTPRWKSSRARSTEPAFHSAMAHACQLAWCPGASFVPCSNKRRATSMLPSTASRRARACSSGGSLGLSLHPLIRSPRARSTNPSLASNTAHDSHTKRFWGSAWSPRWKSLRAWSPLPWRDSSMPQACHSAADCAPASVLVPSLKCSRASCTRPRSAAITPRDWYRCGLARDGGTSLTPLTSRSRARWKLPWLFSSMPQPCHAAACDLSAAVAASYSCRARGTSPARSSSVAHACQMYALSPPVASHPSWKFCRAASTSPSCCSSCPMPTYARPSAGSTALARSNTRMAFRRIFLRSSFRRIFSALLRICRAWYTSRSWLIANGRASPSSPAVDAIT
mmetsp:Transcript_6658/g.17055  ORF Transcript_6658/g.17055 Transcript_6658/m.17055 type:complete len:455 (+) Transcript_6658:1359-2723(+)